jgi:hypothetical protein
MNTIPSQGMDYVNKNIKTSFKYFLSNLNKNDRGYVISSNYPGSEFFHYPDLIDNEKTKSTFYRRYRRFLDFFNNRKCFFLFNVTSAGLENSNDVSLFLDSVNEFHKLTKVNHSLLIYIRHDESFQENEIYCESVEKKLRKLKKTSVVRYIRHKNDYGMWGDKAMYANLLERLGVKLKIGFPKIYLSKT